MNNRELKKALKVLGEDYILELTKQLILADKKATGNLIRSLDYKVIETIDGLMLKIKSDSYLDYVDKGRKKGKFPPIAPIEKWVKVKGIKFEKQTSKQTAFVIARSIKEKGIKPTHVLDKTKKNILQNKTKFITNAVGLDMMKIIDGFILEIKKK